MPGMSRSEAGSLGYLASRQHTASVALARRLQFKALDRRCEQCKEPLSYEKRHNRFCSRSCSGNYYVGTREYRGTGACCKCGVKTSSAVKHCSVCWSEPKQLSDVTGDAARKRILIRDRGYRCQSCGLSEWMGRSISIELDHVDGDCHNNTNENLRLLCPNCHAQTPTYRGRNRGRGKRPKAHNFRPNRKKMEPHPGIEPSQASYEEAPSP
jgi:hypothetical protein